MVNYSHLVVHRIHRINLISGRLYLLNNLSIPWLLATLPPELGNLKSDFCFYEFGFL